ncbi:trypsin-like peptidase domain-containing protein [Salinispora vitiensis]|uniref:trypsin-like peptidase domain-containing protein n=1 Tax=Salinispora vitiensis TaxID=999544 RepID=UPI00036104F9|nr:trypsin-like peptidase domain-containing protein [Salinispora vitiensis]
MTDYESDPQRRQTPGEAEPPHPTADLSRLEGTQSDSSAATPGADRGAALPADAPADRTEVLPPSVPDAPLSADRTEVLPPSVPDAPLSADPAVPLDPQLGAAPVTGPPGGHPYPPGYSPQHPGAPWYGPQSTAWSGGQPGGYGAPFYPGQPAQLPGQATPPWVAPRTGPNPGSRVAKFIGAGVAVLALMFGSGVAGGALALALSDGSGITRTYSAAPIIDSADLPRIAAAVQPSVVSIGTDSGGGSGVILTADGYVLTNNHVIATASGGTVLVTFADGETASAEIKGTDPKTDLAVVKAAGVSDLTPAEFGDSDEMQVGDQVLALGSPLGLQGSVTAGILSARDRTIQAGGSERDPAAGVTSISGLLQTDAPINPGNSGGALVNTRGEVIGINTAIATSGQGSTGNIGVGFAIPSNKAEDVAEKLQRGEKVSHPTLGVSVTAAEGGGALVADVLPGSAAERAGFQQGDVITRFGEKVISDSEDLVAVVQAGKVGDRVDVTYKRNNIEATATVTLAEAS